MNTSSADAKAPDTADGSRSPGTLLVVLAGTFVTQLDFFIVNVAAPSLKNDLHADWAGVQWVIAGYGLALACGLITAGRLGDMYGLRRMFMVGLALFTAASAVCGMAQSIEVLIAARVVQGVAAAMVTPQVLGILNTLYTGRNRMRAFTAFGLTIGFAAVFGQLIGGALIKLDAAGLGWRTIFLINVPIGVAALATTRRLVPPCRHTSSARLDLVGALLVTAGLFAVLLPLIEGRQRGWPSWTAPCLAIAAVLLAAFAAHQDLMARRGGAPLVNLALFRHRAFTAGLLIALFYMLAMASFFLMLAIYLQQGRGLSPLESGMVFSAGGAGYYVASKVVTALVARMGRQTLAVGALTVAVGYTSLVLVVRAIGTSGSIGWILPGLAIAGFGMGTVTAPMSAMVLAGIAPRHAASAAGVLTTAQQVGTALGIAIIGIVFCGRIRPELDSYPPAFQAGLFLLIVFCLVVAGLVQLLPRPARSQRVQA